MSGIFGSSQWMYNSGDNFYNGVVETSVRIDKPSNAYLSKSVSTGDSRTQSTYAWWMKRASDSTAAGTSLPAEIFAFGASGGGATQSSARITLEANKINVSQEDNNATTWEVITTQLLRDSSAWYHCVVVIDTTQSTAADRVKIYINGNKVTSFSTASYPSQDYISRFGLSGTNRIGVGDSSGSPWSSSYFNGYFADMYYLDGVVVSDSSDVISEFGEFKNGVWIPKRYTGSYGTNGFRLQFNQTGTGTGSTTTIGADTSGVSPPNHYTSSGIVASDCSLLDSPENNFCTYNPLDPKGNDNTFSEGNLKVVVNAQNTDEQTTATFAVSSGKWYWEHRLNSTTTTAGYFKIGLRGTDADGSAWTVRGTDGETQDSSGTTGSSSVSYTTGNVIGVYLDMDNGKWYVSVDGVLQNSANLTNGTGFLHSNLTGELRPFILNASSGGTHTGQGNFGQDSTFSGLETAGGNADENGNGDFHSSVFSGYLALCTANLPEPTISPNADTQADNFFGILTWSGDDNATRKIATGESAVTGTVDFTPDFSWIKRRNGSSNGSDHLLLDIVRGVDAFNGLSTNSSQEEGLTEAGSTWSNFGDINNFEDGGFTVQKGTDPSHTLEGINQSGGTYVAWNWKLGGTAVSNTDGTITSTVSASTDAGFSIVTYTGNGTGGTIGHGLGSSPEITIIKKRSGTENWYYQSEVQLGAWTYNLRLDTDQSKLTSTTFVTGVSDDTVTVSTSTAVNGSSTTYVMYCFRSIEGYSKIGTYTGNSSADGTFVYLGFRPKFVLIKKTNGAASWWLVDAVRDTYNPTDSYILPDNIATDRTYTTADFVSNGFKIRNTSTAFNSGTHIYMAFAETPTKYSLAR